MAEQFVGSGWAFPLRIGPTGGIALVSGEREVEEAIRLVLATAPGERPMRPDFGCAIHDMVFAPVNEATAGRIQHEVYASLDRWEPRIEVDEVAVTAGDEQGVLFIDVRYSIRGTNNPRSLVFPFYTIPSHEGPEGPDGSGSSGGSGNSGGSGGPGTFGGSGGSSAGPDNHFGSDR
ncbi:GPW/gp25 family protein [Streptomyces sp. NPDC087850]|uniref:GPW/gp25 family protein n=1 Tax=Streptomyces sp. NPDC087850 TaxID=3365809 RepID=UPI0037F67C87